MIPMPTTCTSRKAGFTLIEAVMVIAITGIIGAILAVFIRAPVQAYFDVARRAEMTDIADTALRRISRDLHLALPNSVRVTGGPTNFAIEFFQTRTAGRYRAEKGAPTDNELVFSSGTDTSFDIIGPPMTFVAGDQVVIYNLGIPGADAYTGKSAATDNRRDIVTTGTTTSVTITSSNALPFDSPNHTFYVVDTPVSYVCDLTAGTLKRYSGYTATPAQANPPASVAPSPVLVAKNVTACEFRYTTGVTERSGLVTLRLTITLDDASVAVGQRESVTLVQQVHVSNAP
jgi:MSHA biogenesis protein MshO